MKNKKMKVIVALCVFGGFAIVAQGIENHLDKAAVASYVSNHFVENDENDMEDTFNFKDEKEDSFIEWLGF